MIRIKSITVDLKVVMASVNIFAVRENGELRMAEFKYVATRYRGGRVRFRFERV